MKKNIITRLPGTATKLDGFLVGIGKIDKSGSEEIHWLDKPKHNRIVNLAGLLRYDGSNTGGLTFSKDDYSTLWNIDPFVGHYGNHYSPLYYAAHGSDGTATTSSMTALNAMIGTYTSTLKTAAPFRGMEIDASTGLIRLRVTHVHAAETDAQTVREVGWFGRYGDTPTYEMFSRVVLDFPTSLDSGEQLISVYELQIQLSPWTAESVSFTIDGSTVQAQQKYTGYIIKGSTDAWQDSLAAFPGPRAGVSYDWSSSSRDGYAYGIQALIPWLYSSYSTDWTDVGWGGSGTPGVFSTDKSFPTANTTYESTPTYTYSASGDASVSFLDYTPGSNYRDIKFTMGAQWPNGKSSISIPYMVIRGLAFRFGHYDTDGTTWISTPLTKGATQRLTVTLRTAYTTD